MNITTFLSLKRIFCIVVIFVFGLSLVGCGGSPKKKESVVEPEKSEAQPKPEATEVQSEKTDVEPEKSEDQPKPVATEVQSEKTDVEPEKSEAQPKPEATEVQSEKTDVEQKGSLSRKFAIVDEQGRKSGSLTLEFSGGAVLRDENGKVIGKFKPVESSAVQPSEPQSEPEAIEIQSEPEKSITASSFMILTVTFILIPSFP